MGAVRRGGRLLPASRWLRRTPTRPASNPHHASSSVTWRECRAIAQMCNGGDAAPRFPGARSFQELTRCLQCFVTPTPPCGGFPSPSFAVQCEATIWPCAVSFTPLRAQFDVLASSLPPPFAGVAVVNISRSRFSQCTMSDSFPSPEQGGILLSHRPESDARAKMFRLTHEPGCARALHCKGAAVDSADPEAQLAKCKSQYRRLQIGFLYNKLTGNGCSAFPMTKWMLEEDSRRYSYWCTARHGVSDMRGTMLNCI